MRHYTITLNEEQLMLVSSCIEDIHRFLCGDTELCGGNCEASSMNCNRLSRPDWTAAQTTDGTEATAPTATSAG